MPYQPTQRAVIDDVVVSPRNAKGARSQFGRPLSSRNLSTRTARVSLTEHSRSGGPAQRKAGPVPASGVRYVTFANARCLVRLGISHQPSADVPYRHAMALESR